MYYVYIYYKILLYAHATHSNFYMVKHLWQLLQILNKNKIRTSEAEIGPQNKNIEAGQNFTDS